MNDGRHDQQTTGLKVQLSNPEPRWGEIKTLVGDPCAKSQWWGGGGFCFLLYSEQGGIFYDKKETKKKGVWGNVHEVNPDLHV